MRLRDESLSVRPSRLSLPKARFWLVSISMLCIGLSTSEAWAGATVPLGKAASDPAELEGTFEEAAVVASKLSPGGDAVFFSVAREPQGYYHRIVRRSGVEVVDALGEARFEVAEGEVPLKSVWVVADVATGAFSVAAPEGFFLRELPFPGRAFEVGAPGVVTRLRHAAEEVDLVMVRPGEGGWSLCAWDLSPKDRDEEDDDRVVTSLADLEAVDAVGLSPPARFAAGDVLVVINPRDLTYYATRLLGPPQPNGGDE